MITVAASSGLLIVGHGTRDKRGVRHFLSVVGQVAKLMPDRLVEPGFLELASPTISEGVKRLVDRGARQIQAVPLLLFAARHVHRDIPGLLAAARAESAEPTLKIQQLSHLGCRRQIVELSARRYQESLPCPNTVSSQETALVLVGRGGRDGGAFEEMHHFADLRSREIPVGIGKVCFLAVQRPTLEEVLPQIASTGVKQIVIQPHLLFPGSLIAQVRAKIEVACQKWPTSQWVVTEPLGPDRLLAESVVAIASSHELEPAGSGCRN